MKEYKINEDWFEITNAPSKLTLCPIIKPTAKAMIFIGSEVDGVLSNVIYVLPFDKQSFELKSGEKLFVKCTSESGSLIISNTIIQGCK